MARKTIRNEVKTTKAVNLSWDTILRALNASDSEVSKAEKRKIALEVCKKTAPKTVDIGDKTIDTFTSLMKQFWINKKKVTS